MDEIVVLGGGYAGMTAATSLAGRLRGQDDVRVTLVDASERFTERLRLHQVASGQRVSDLRFADALAGSPVDFVRGRVVGLDPDGRAVRLADGRTLAYDRLVFGLGGVADTAVAGVAEHAYTLSGRDGAERLAARLETLGSGTVVVGGSGLAGVESAAEIAEAHPELHVVLLGREEPGARLGRRARTHLQAALARLGVEVRAGVEILGIGPEKVELADGAIGADAVLWASGVRGSPLAGAAGLEVDDRGRVVTDRTLRSVSHPEIHAVGDAAAIRQAWGELHGTCQSGMPTGVHAAASIARLRRGQEPRPFRYGYVHTPISLGRHDAVVQFVHPDDRPGPVSLTGRAAVRYKETVTSAPWPSFPRMLTQPWQGSFAWRRGGRYTR